MGTLEETLINFKYTGSTEEDERVERKRVAVNTFIWRVILKNVKWAVCLHSVLVHSVCVYIPLK